MPNLGMHCLQTVISAGSISAIGWPLLKWRQLLLSKLLRITYLKTNTLVLQSQKTCWFHSLMLSTLVGVTGEAFADSQRSNLTYF